MLSGGSTASTSLIWFAITLTEQTVPSGRLLVGSSVIDEPGEPLTVKLSGVPVGHSSENELVVAVTDSLKLTTMFVFTATWVAPSAGEIGRASCRERAGVDEEGGLRAPVVLMLPASAVPVQTVASGRSHVGSRVIDEPGEPLTEKLSGVPDGHSIVNELLLTVTDSLKLTTIFVFTATWVAPSAGDVVVTDGAASAVVNEKT